MATNSLTATLRLQLIDAVSGGAKGIEASLGKLDGRIRSVGAGGTPGIKKLVSELDNLKRRGNAFDVFANAQGRLSAARNAFRNAQTDVKNLATSIGNMGSATPKMKSALASARDIVRQAAGSFRQEADAAKAAKTALEQFGKIPAGNIARTQAAIRKAIDETTKKLKQQHDQVQRPSGRSRMQNIGGALAGSGIVYGGQRGIRMSVANALEFDQAQNYQRAIGKYSAAEQKPMTEQAFRIGGATRFTNADIVNAQNKIVQAGIRDPNVVMGMIESITDYGLAMSTTMDDAAETVRSALMVTGKDVRNPKTIGKDAKDMVNRLVKMAKNSGMGDEDVRNLLTYSGGPMSNVGVKDSTYDALAMTLRQGGYKGDVSGVALRSMAAHMISPTNKGRAALASSGINYDDYVNQGKGIRNVDNLSGKMRLDFGKSIPDDMKTELEAALANQTFTNDAGQEQSILTDKGQFTAAVVDIVKSLFTDGKGKVKTADSNKLAKKVGEFYDFSAESVNTDKLINDIIAAKLNQAVLNAAFTDKHGGKIGSIDPSLYGQNKTAMENIDPNTASEMSGVINSGLPGAWNQLTGSFETLLTKVGRSMENILIPAFEKTADVLNAISNLPAPILELGAAATAAAIALGTISTARSITGLLGGAAGGAAAGTAAAGGGILSGAVSAGGAALSSPAGMAILGGAVSLAALALAFPAEKVRGRPGQYGQRMYPPKTQGGQGDVAILPGIQGDTGALDTLKAKAAETGAAMKESLNISAAPYVDPSSIDSILAKARAAGQAIASLGGASYPQRTKGGHSDARPMPSGGGIRPSAIMGHRAKGGPAIAGRTYILGEEGPEPVTFGSTAHVSRANTITNRSGDSFVFNVTGSNPHEIANQISRMLERKFGRSSQLSLDGRAIA
jgi:Phage-related minor tail protein